jgi:hypothetical protein
VSRRQSISEEAMIGFALWLVLIAAVAVLSLALAR